MKILLISETYPYNPCSCAMLRTYVAVGISREAVYRPFGNSREQEINALILNHSLTHLFSVERGTQTKCAHPVGNTYLCLSVCLSFCHSDLAIQ